MNLKNLSAVEVETLKQALNIYWGECKETVSYMKEKGEASAYVVWQERLTATESILRQLKA